MILFFYYFCDPLNIMRAAAKSLMIDVVETILLFQSCCRLGEYRISSNFLSGVVYTRASIVDLYETANKFEAELEANKMRMGGNEVEGGTFTING